jgi:hypothetical protein
MPRLGALGAGPHVIDVGAARDFAPGVYLVRLSRAGALLTRRAVVVGR